MASHYQDIGFDVREFGDIVNLYENNPDKYEAYDVDGKYDLFILNDDGDCRIRLHIDNLTQKIYWDSPDYQSDQFSMARVVEWITYDDKIYQGLLRIEDIYEDLDIPLNVEVLGYKKTLVGEAPSLRFVHITAFAEHIELYDSADAICVTEMAPESLIPCGTFPLKDDSDFEESARIICNGVVTGVKKCINPITNNEFYNISLYTLGIGMTVVAAPEYFKRMPEIGDYIHGQFYLFAEIEGEDNPPDTERSDCADITGVKLPASDAVLEWISTEIDLLMMGQRCYFAVNFKDKTGRDRYIQSKMNDSMTAIYIEYNLPESTVVTMPDGSKNTNQYQQFAKEFGDKESALKVFEEALRGDGNINTSGWRDITESILAESYVLESKSASSNLS